MFICASAALLDHCSTNRALSRLEIGTLLLNSHNPRFKFNRSRINSRGQLCTRSPPRGNANQRPPTINKANERSARVPLT